MNMKLGQKTIQYNDSHYKGHIKWIYIITMVIMAITGLGQMPIFKRYYIADIPGLGWTAKYFVTHNIHYIGAIVLLALIAYSITIYFIYYKENYSISPAGYIRIALLGGIGFSGIFKVIANQKGIYLSQQQLIVFDAVHTGFTFLLFFSLLIFVIKKWGWKRGYYE